MKKLIDIIAIGLLFSATAFAQVAPVQSYDVDIQDRSARAFNITVGAENTQDHSFTLFQDGEYYDATGYSAELRYAKNKRDAAAGMGTLAGTVDGSNVLFSPVANTFVETYEDGYAVIVLRATDENVSYAWGRITVTKSPEIGSPAEFYLTPEYDENHLDATEDAHEASAISTTGPYADVQSAIDGKANITYVDSQDADKANLVGGNAFYGTQYFNNDIKMEGVAGLEFTYLDGPDPAPASISAVDTRVVLKAYGGDVFRLSHQPSGDHDLAIATTKYVQDNLESLSLIKTSTHTATIDEGSTVEYGVNTTDSPVFDILRGRLYPISKWLDIGAEFTLYRHDDHHGTNAIYRTRIDFQTDTLDLAGADSTTILTSDGFKANDLLLFRLLDGSEFEFQRVKSVDDLNGTSLRNYTLENPLTRSYEGSGNVRNVLEYGNLMVGSTDDLYWRIVLDDAQTYDVPMVNWMEYK